MLSAATFLLILTFAVAPSVEGHQQQNQNGQSPTTQQTQAVSEFYKKCLGEDAGAITIVGPSKTQHGQAYGLLHARVLGLSGKADNLGIKPEDGVPLKFSRPGRMAEPGTEGRTHKDAISETAAWEAALPVLEFYGLPVSRGEYTIEMRDMDSPKGKDDLYGAEWDVSKDLEYNGVPCRDCQIAILVSAVSGKVFLVLYLPVIVPPDVEQEITKSAAVESARAWLNARPYFAGKEITLGQQELDKVEKVVARPNDGFLMGEPGYGSIKKGAFWCWEVPFAFVEGRATFPGRIWVRVDSGEVIGAGYGGRL